MKHREYWIQTNTGYGWDDECCCENRKEAQELLKVYNKEMPQYSHRITYHLIEGGEADD